MFPSVILGILESIVLGLLEERLTLLARDMLPIAEKKVPLHLLGLQAV